MKFLITATTREQPPPLPPEALPEIMGAHREWLSDRVADGTIDFIYGFAEGRGGVAIANAEAGDELNSILLSSPAFPLFAFEIRPLAHIETTIDNAIEMFRRMGERLPAYR